MTTERRYDIDWLRVIAIALLLIYHIAIVFQPWAMFIGFIKSETYMETFWKGMTMLNVWRIPLLFFVSGMGVYFAMRRRNIGQFLFERTKRIGIPYIFGIIAITPLHMFIFQHYYKMPLNYFPHPGHLWFLGNILIYVAILFPLFNYLLKNEEGKIMGFFSSFMSNPLGPLSISIFFVAEALFVNPAVFSMYAQTMHGYVIGFLAFLFGFIFVYSGKPFWQTVAKWKWLYLGIGAALYLVRLLLFETQAPNYLMAIESNAWIFGVFGLGYTYLNRPSNLLSYLSQAAYPVYIIHMFALYAGAAIFLPLELAVEVKFVLINIFTFALCFLIYELLIRRFVVLRPLFGLKWNFEFKDRFSILSKPIVQTDQSE